MVMSLALQKAKDITILPNLTAEQKTLSERLAAQPDENIDFSEIPKTSQEDWKRATIGRFLPAKSKL
jgi:hypothetical protein